MHLWFYKICKFKSFKDIIRMLEKNIIKYKRHKEQLAIGEV